MAGARKDAFYFPHDSNARNDPKVTELRGKFGWAGYGVYWAIIECLREQSNCKWPSHRGRNGLALACQWGAIDPIFKGVTFDDFIDFCIEIKLLREAENCLFSDSLIARMLLVNAARERLIESGKKGAAKRWGGHWLPNATPMAVKENKYILYEPSGSTPPLKNKRQVFIPPSLKEVENYCKERKNNVQAASLHSFYESKGWMVGKNKMKDWRAAVRHWEGKENERTNTNKPRISTSAQEDRRKALDKLGDPEGETGPGDVPQM